MGVSQVYIMHDPYSDWSKYGVSSYARGRVHAVRKTYPELKNAGLVVVWTFPNYLTALGVENAIGSAMGVTWKPKEHIGERFTGLRPMWVWKHTTEILVQLSNAGILGNFTTCVPFPVPKIMRGCYL